MIPALAPASLQVAGHRMVGASTGYMSGSYGDWPALLEQATATSTLAVELSALSETELPSLVDFLAEANALPFLFVSVHAPTKDRKLAEAELVATLAQLTHKADAIVVHPDVAADLSAYRELGSTLVIENLDCRKEIGQTAEHLDRVFDVLPEAGLCFDIPHAASVDPTLAIAQAILDFHGARLRHVHLSSLDADCHHQPLTGEDEKRFAELLDRCRDVPWILEAPPPGRAAAVGALEQLPGAPERFRAIPDARALTHSRLADLRGKIEDVPLPDGTALVLFGSWGRAELTDESDVDWAVIVDEPDLAVDGPAVSRAVERLRGLIEGEGKPPGGQQTFGGAFHGWRLVEHIGLADDDSANITRRLLLLLESVAVTSPNIHDRLKRRVLERYLTRHSLGEQFAALATDRVARAFLHLGLADPGARALGAYSDWIDLLSDGQNRARLEGLTEETRHEDDVFRAVRRAGHQLDNGLLALLYETDLGAIAQRFVAI